ncbi:MAG: 3-deoxy-7-phosphoheptulonate synthase [Candidatus Binatus sp.]|uniref:3-deoxy-7-phosphoheptulonate synthase n=1 Tax=Candidatus Binatus sp. TaxID=2811406 RepID=UPI002726F429|nr:3-deoxy-7-phosphoheptulonate synthase [Candidatus Binatus sp.]MDO8433038.1 3-deoxy-7-phosphoheptulonate synthase [Candidatus Binatus sp.]
MIVVMKAHATEEEIQAVVRMVEDLDYKAHVISGIERSVVACVGDERGAKHQLTHLESVAGVERVMPVVKSFKLASREVRPEGSTIRIGNAEIGGKRLAVIAGPCAIESEAQIEAAADAVKAAGAHMLRGGAFKPRTSPYSFQGMEGEGLVLLEKAGRRVGLPVVTEIMDPHDIDLVVEHADVLQVGARNAQNFSLLRRLGRTNKPILLKRGMSTKLEEFMMAAEYILSEGNPNVILCERGIRTFETATRNTLDLNAVPLLKEWSHLPVVVDPSHGTGIYSLVAPMALAAIAAGADGLLIEVHPKPESALSDGPQQLKPARFANLMKALKPLAEAVGRTI